MAQALYRKYRSKSLDQVVGQPHITNILKKALARGRINHAYLLTGPRGVGKTSVARILAYEINKLPYSEQPNLDIIEIDAASNNGVDDVRDLREKIIIVPVNASKKIYIIDEVHMLSKQAFNALLKTLEEPPSHVVFVLATTEVHKLPDTILSRTQRFHFRLISPADMQQHLRFVADAEKITITDEALELIAKRANGSFRDGISLLDQLSNLSDKNINAEMIVETLGLATAANIEKLGLAITSHQLKEVVELLDNLEQNGVSATILSQQLADHLKTLITTQPQLINLIESLIEVIRSPDPSLKLLALTASATVSPAEIMPSAPHRSMALLASTAPVVREPKAVLVKTISKPASRVTAQEAFNWPVVLERIRTHNSILFGVLTRAEARYDSGVLNLHFSYSLHRKKLETGKYRQVLIQTLNTLYSIPPEVTLSNGRKAPSGAEAAAVAAIMGGGEEVDINL